MRTVYRREDGSPHNEPPGREIEVSDEAIVIDEHDDGYIQQEVDLGLQVPVWPLPPPP